MQTATEPDLELVSIPVVWATPENISDYGVFIGTEIPNSGLKIPFYKGSVEEGHNLPFFCEGKAVVRTARIHPRSGHIQWLERHERMTQLFLGLGDSPMAVVLGKPNHQNGEDRPRIEDLKVYVLPPGHGVMIHAGTWHDFPMALQKPVTVFTMNSEEVVQALVSQPTPDEMNRGDVYKIDVQKRLRKDIFVDLPNFSPGIP